jgi:hypothetical protein
MTKYWRATLALVAVISSPALAQSLTSETTTATETVTTTPPPVVDATRTTKTEKSVDANGVEINKARIVTTGPAGTSATSASQKTGPNGETLSTAHRQETVSPSGDKTMNSETTTTTPGR